jgi:hypothetical protein
VENRLGQPGAGGLNELIDLCRSRALAALSAFPGALKGGVWPQAAGTLWPRVCGIATAHRTDLFIFARTMSSLRDGTSLFFLLSFSFGAA